MFTRLRALAHHINHRKMSTASGTTIINSNPACCSIPPVSSNYIPKGTYKSYAGFDTVYITGPGPGSSDMAIIAVYDIFGFKPQTQQGADMLSKAMNATVLMPDFFEPKAPWDSNQFPPQTDKDKEELQAFFGGPAKPQDAVVKLIKVGESLRKDGAKYIGSYGLCWGGKVTILAGSESSSVFNAISAVHPAMLSAPDADNLTVPLGLFISKDEPKAEYDKMIETLSDKPFAKKNMYKFYPTMFHGWAGARANLEDPENKKQFEDLYATLRGFFSNAFERDRGGSQARL